MTNTYKPIRKKGEEEIVKQKMGELEEKERHLEDYERRLQTLQQEIELLRLRPPITREIIREQPIIQKEIVREVAREDSYAEQKPRVQLKYCDTCCVENPLDAKFCRKCGTKLGYKV